MATPCSQISSASDQITESIRIPEERTIRHPSYARQYKKLDLITAETDAEREIA
jgi:hypothetical protein